MREELIRLGRLVDIARLEGLGVAAAASLRELFAPAIHRERIAGMLEHHDFIDDRVMAYFKDSAPVVFAHD